MSGDVLWGWRTPGDIATVVTDGEDLHGVVLGDPDWVGLPEALGGNKVRVLRIFRARCPKHPHEVKHYALDGKAPDGSALFVAECPLGEGEVMFYGLKADEP